MIINNTNNIPHFEARIKINKPRIESRILESAGCSSVTGGSSIIVAGTASGSDMIVHGVNSAIPSMQNSFSLFDTFVKLGHKMLEIFSKPEYKHDGYDASFFSTALTGSGIGTYSHGMNTVIKGIEKNYNTKIPT